MREKTVFTRSRKVIIIDLSLQFISSSGLENTSTKYFDLFLSHQYILTLDMHFPVVLKK